MRFPVSYNILQVLKGPNKKGFMKTVESTVAFQDQAGNALARGSLMLTLPFGIYEIAAGGGQVAGQTVTVNLDGNGKIPSGSQIWASDELVPQPTYNATLCAQPNGLQVVGGATWSIIGSSPIDLSQMVSTSPTVSYPAPVLLNTTSPLNGSLSVTGNVTGADWTGSGPSPWVDVTHPRYGADPTGMADSTAAFNSALTALQNGNGGTLFVPIGTYLIAGQISVPNNSANPPLQKAMRIVGEGSGGVVQFFPDGGCSGGSILNMTHNTTTGKIDTRGLGKLEITGLCFEDTNTDFTPWIFTTLTNIHVHDNQFYGNTTHYPAGCCLTFPPTQTGQPGLVLGGTGTTTNGSATDMFQGYGTVIENNQFDYCGVAILLQNETNSVNIHNNHFFNHCTNVSTGVIEVNPGASGATFRSAITDNLIEVGGSKYGIHLVQNVNGYYIAGNACWDSVPAQISSACVKEEASAGNVDNFVITVQQDSNTGTPLPDTITNSSARIQNGRYLAAWNSTNIQNCVTPAFGTSNADNGGGMSINGGGTAICNGGALSMLFNNNFLGDNEGGSGMVLAWQPTANPVWSFTPDTQISRPGAGVVSIDTTSAGNSSGTLKASAIKSASLVGPSNGNTVTLLNSQGALSPLTGNSTDQTIYTYTMPANTVGAGKGVRIQCNLTHSTGSAAITYKVLFGGTSFQTATITDSLTQEYFANEIYNNAGVTNAQHARGWGSRNGVYSAFAHNNTGSVDTTSSVVIQVTFNAANTEQVTPDMFTVELIQ